jgi:general secretion pathway protein I
VNRIRRGNRGAYSLLEVILALAILVGALAVLGELVRIGTRSAAAARDLSVAQLLCESKLAEISAAEALPGPTSRPASFGADYPQADGWVYTVAIKGLPQSGLHRVTVTVSQDLPAAERPLEFALVRWIRDPAYVEQLQQEDEQNAAQAAQSQQAAQPQEESP